MYAATVTTSTSTPPSGRLCRVRRTARRRCRRATGRTRRSRCGRCSLRSWALLLGDEGRRAHRRTAAMSISMVRTWGAQRRARRRRSADRVGRRRVQPTLLASVHTASEEGSSSCSSWRCWAPSTTMTTGNDTVTMPRCSSGSTVNSMNVDGATTCTRTWPRCGTPGHVAEGDALQRLVQLAAGRRRHRSYCHTPAGGQTGAAATSRPSSRPALRRRDAPSVDHESVTPNGASLRQWPRRSG